MPELKGSISCQEHRASVWVLIPYVMNPMILVLMKMISFRKKQTNKKSLFCTSWLSVNRKQSSISFLFMVIVNCKLNTADFNALCLPDSFLKQLLHTAVCLVNSMTAHFAVAYVGLNGHPAKPIWQFDKTTLYYK